jgi:cytochrome c oxidase subunit 4
MAQSGVGVANHGGHAVDDGAHEHAHPGQKKYIEIALILAAITIIEVAIYYIQWVHDEGILVPALLAMSAVKFFTVVSYFMHLKFDDRRLTIMFVTGLVTAFLILMALYALFHWHVIDFATAPFEGSH